MILFLEVLFWACIAAILYTYALFPFVLTTVARRKKQRAFPPLASKPTVAIVFAARNEEAVLAKKLENICQLNYPHELLEVWIGSDASTDRTDEIIADFAARYPFIHGVRFKNRMGKAPILNRLMERISADIVIFTDADVLFMHNICDHLLPPFGDASIGLVSAQLVRCVPQHQGFQTTEMYYNSTESKLKLAEAMLFGKIMGADGQCYAIRRELYKPFPENRLVTDDLLQTLWIISQNYQTWYAEQALCYTDVSETPQEELMRRTRIATSNFSTLAFLPPPFLLPWTVEGWLFYSHKLLKWLGPILLFVALSTSLLLWQAHISYRISSIALAVSLLLPWLPPALHKGFIGHWAHFMAINYTILKGLLQYWQKKTTPIWQSPKRNLSTFNKAL